MNNDRQRYHRHRFPPEIISHAVWLYHRFCLSFRDVEDLLAERGIVVTHETVRQWCRKFGPYYARKLRRRHGRLGDTWHLDELFVNIQGRRHYLWRTGASCHQSFMTPGAGRTTEQRSRISLPGKGRGRCASSRPRLKHNGFCRHKVSF